MSGLHKNIPVGAECAHPPGFVQATDPGAVGAHKVWVDTSTTPYTWKIRNADDTDWATIAGPAVYGSAEDLTTLETWQLSADDALGDHENRITALEGASGEAGLLSVTLQFGDGVNAATAGMWSAAHLPAGFTPTAWRASAQKADGSLVACDATFAVYKRAAAGGALADLVGTGTAPALSADDDAGDTDGAVDWSGGSVEQFGTLAAQLASYAPGDSTVVFLTIFGTRS